MFEMFRGGKPDAVTMMAVTHEERRNDLSRVVRYIKLNHKPGDIIDIEEIADECGVYDLSDAEIGYIEDRLNR